MAKGGQPGAVPTTWPPGTATPAHRNCPLVAPALSMGGEGRVLSRGSLAHTSGHLGQGLTIRGGSTITMELRPCSVLTAGSTSHGGRRDGVYGVYFKITRNFLIYLPPDPSQGLNTPPFLRPFKLSPIHQIIPINLLHNIAYFCKSTLNCVQALKIRFSLNK